MPGKPATVKEYLDSLPEDRRKAISKVRAAVNKGLPKGYKEGIQYGMIGWNVPHSLFPQGYHCDPEQPLPFACLANQKNHMSLGIMSTYMDAAEGKRFRDAWLKTGKKLDMGKCCVRFRNVEDVPLEVIGQAIKRVPAKQYIALYEKMLGPQRLAKRKKK